MQPPLPSSPGLETAQSRGRVLCRKPGNGPGDEYIRIPHSESALVLCAEHLAVPHKALSVALPLLPLPCFRARALLILSRWPSSRAEKLHGPAIQRVADALCARLPRGKWPCMGAPRCPFRSAPSCRVPSLLSPTAERGRMAAPLFIVCPENVIFNYPPSGGSASQFLSRVQVPANITPRGLAGFWPAGSLAALGSLALL